MKTDEGQIKFWAPQYLWSVLRRLPFVRTSMAMLHPRHYSGRHLRPDRRDHVFDVDLSGLGKLERGLDPLALSERLLEPEQHEVEGVGRELHALPRLDLEAARNRAHHHDALVHGHLVHLHLPGYRRGAADQTVVIGPLIGDGHVGAPN